MRVVYADWVVRKWPAGDTTVRFTHSWKDMNAQDLKNGLKYPMHNVPTALRPPFEVQHSQMAIGVRSHNFEVVADINGYP